MYIVRKVAILIAVSIMIGILTAGCAKPAAPVNPNGNHTIQPDVSSSPASLNGSQIRIPASSPPLNIETYKDETHKQIQYGQLSFEISSYYHIVYRAHSDETETFKCETDQDIDWQPMHTMMIVVIRGMEKQDFPDTESIVAYLRDLSPKYERLNIYNDVTDDSGIIDLYSVTGGGLTNYVICYQDACYFIESDNDMLDAYLFDHEANYREDRLKIECTDSFITDVNKTVFYHEDEFAKAEYDIAQCKDGTKYIAELIRGDEYHFTLQNENGENLLTLYTYGPPDEIVQFKDLNMDGYADIQFLEEPGAWNNCYALYVWDDTAQSFIKVKCDEMLSTVDVYDGYLLNWQKADIESGAVQKLVWDGNTLVLESEEPYLCGE